MLSAAWELISAFLKLETILGWWRAWRSNRKERQVQDAQAAVNRDSDADVDRELRAKYTRD